MSTLSLLDVTDSALLLIDMQTVLLPKIVDHEAITKHQAKLIQIARDLDVPIIVSEHYSKGLGATSDELKDALGEAYQPIEKITFSTFGHEPFVDAVKALNRKSLVMIGIETHICVLQSALDAVQLGYHVSVVGDCVSNRKPTDHELAIAKMRQHNIEVDTWESVAYQWLKRAGTPEFKKVLPHFKEA